MNIKQVKVALVRFPGNHKLYEYLVPDGSEPPMHNDLVLTHTGMGNQRGEELLNTMLVIDSAAAEAAESCIDKHTTTVIVVDEPETEMPSDDDDDDAWPRAKAAKTRCKAVAPLHANSYRENLITDFSVAIVVGTKDVAIHETKADKPYIMVIRVGYVDVAQRQATNFVESKTKIINAIRKLDRMLKDQDRVEAWSRLAAGNAEAARLLKLLTKD